MKNIYAKNFIFILCLIFMLTIGGYGLWLSAGSRSSGVSRGYDPLVAGRGFDAPPEKGRQGAKRTLEGGTRSASPSRMSLPFFPPSLASGQQQLPAPGKVEVRSVEPFVYCSLSREGAFSEIESTVGELIQHMQNQMVYPTGAMIGIYHGDPGLTDADKMRWEIGFPINEQAQVLAPLEKKQWSFSQVAVSVHQGPYDAIGETILKIQEWLEENGYSQAGPILERYLDPDPSQASSSSLKTEIWIPCVKR